MRKTRVFAWTMVGCGLATFGCSSTSGPGERSPERLGVQQQRVAGAHKVCQLVGDADYQTGSPTKGLTATSAGVIGTDLGYPVHDTSRNRVWFLFGDMFPSGPAGAHTAPDPLGYADGSLPADDCPALSFVKTGASFDPITLVGHPLGGFAVPTGATYDASTDRILSGFMWPQAAGSPPTASALGWAAATSPTAFTPFSDGGTEIPNDPDHFLIMAPSVVNAATVTNASDLPGSSSSVLLVFGTGVPMRLSAVYLAAVRLDQVSVASSWRFFMGGSAPWSASSGAAKRIFHEAPPIGTTDPLASGCAGEISVTYNAIFRKWMMMYKCPLTGTGGRVPTPDGVVVLRTAPRPEGPWSAAIPLFVPKYNGAPADGDPAYGAFIHRGNLRMKRNSWLGPLVRLSGDPADPSNPSPLPTSCVPSNGFPAYCAAPINHNPAGYPGQCCTQADRCCDAMFDKISLTPTEGMSSGRDGAVYAPYIVQPWSRALDGSATQPATKQKLFYVVSTWNPYTVVLMSNELTDNDVDNDGVDDASDNCPAAFNPGQENCNEAAEDAWNERHAGEPLLQVSKLGDACDPVPCPAKAFDKVTTVVQTGSCSTNPWTPSLCTGRTVRERMDLKPVGSSPLTEHALASEVPLSKNITVPNVPTESRFCQHRFPDFICSDPTKMGDEQLTRYASAADEEFDPAAIWHRVKLFRVCAPGEFDCLSGFGLPRGGQFSMSYGTDRRRYVWEYADDEQFWLTDAPFAPIIPGNPSTSCLNIGFFGSGTCLAGRFWTHGVTPVGRDGLDGHDSVSGIHVGWHGDELANHFVEAVPDRPFAWVQGGLQMRPFFFIKLTLPDPAPTWKLSAGAVLPVVAEEGQISVVFDDGHREGITGVFSGAAQTALANTSFAWLSPEEASPRAGSAARPIGVALEQGPDSMHLSETLMDIGGGLVDVGGAPQIMSGGSAPRARTGYVSVYSRARGRVFLAGGVDASTGTPLTDIWSFELDRQVWKRVPRVSAEFLEIKAMTYSYRDGHLWVLDRDARDPALVSWRLIRIDPTTGSWEVVHATQPSAAPPAYADLRALGVDMNGDVVLTVSNTSPQRHRIAILTTRAGGYDVASTSCRQRALVTPALSDLRGHVLYFKEDAELDTSCVDEGQPQLLVPAERIEALPLHGATLSTLEELLH